MDKKILTTYLIKELGFSKKEAQEETNKFTSNATLELQNEFEFYLEHKYFSGNLITIKGYTAKILLESKIAINPYAAYNIMRQLSDEPDKMLQGIQLGFKMK